MREFLMKIKEIKDLKDLDIKDIKMPEIPIPKSLNIAISTAFLSQVLFRKDGRVERFLELSLDRRIELLESLTRTVRRDILMHIPEEDLVEILQTVDPD